MGRRERRDGWTDVSLFSGAGGLALGLENAGFGPFHFYELDPGCCQTLQYNIVSKSPTLHGVVHPGDVRHVEWSDLEPKVRLLAAGFPCQPFSWAGNGLGDADGRNMAPEVIRAVRELEPEAVVLENVGGLLRPAFRSYFDYIVRQLEYPSIAPEDGEEWREHDRRLKARAKNGRKEYNAMWKPIDAADFGVPQNRRRILIVTTRRSLSMYSIPAPTHSRIALLVAQRNGAYWERHGLRKPNALPMSHLRPKDADGLLPWVTVRDVLRNLPDPVEGEDNGRDPRNMNHWTIPGARFYVGHDGSLLDWPSKTIKAGVHGVPGGENTVRFKGKRVRYYTFREAARIQTFPDDYHFMGDRYHVTSQLGNAVPCKLGTVIGEPLLRMLVKKGHARRR